MRTRKLLPLLLLLGALSSKATTLPITFYTEKIKFTSLAKYTLEVPNDLDDVRLKAIADKWATQTEIQKVAKEIDSVSRQLDLCSWFRYQLIVKYVNQCFPKAKEKEQRVYEWYLLNKQGYDARINFGKKINVFARLEKAGDCRFLYVELEGKRFINLNNESLSEYFISRLSLNGKESVDFMLSDLRPPKITNCVLEERKVELTIEGNRETISYKINKTISLSYLDYPTSYKNLFDVALSKETEASLFPELCTKLLVQDTLESIRRLLTLVQKINTYEDDRTFYGHEKPMAPEEVLYYSHSDCEDRAALFYHLVKSFYGYPMVALSYPDHVNVAIELPHGNYKDVLSYKGRRYVVCEPTVITLSSELGHSQAYQKYKKAKVEIEFRGTSTTYNCSQNKP